MVENGEHVEGIIKILSRCQFKVFGTLFEKFGVIWQHIAGFEWAVTLKHIADDAAFHGGGKLIREWHIRQLRLGCVRQKQIFLIRRQVGIRHNFVDVLQELVIELRRVQF